MRACTRQTGKRGSVHPSGNLDSAASPTSRTNGKALASGLRQPRSRTLVPRRSARARRELLRRRSLRLIQQRRSSESKECEKTDCDPRTAIQPQRPARVCIAGSADSISPACASSDSTLEQPTGEHGFQGWQGNIHLGGGEPEAPADLARVSLIPASISPIVAPATPVTQTGESALLGVRQSVHTIENGKELALAAPVLHYDNPHDERQERMRQLANVFIDMFLASHAEKPEESSQKVA